jgi:hypothetical protein
MSFDVLGDLNWLAVIVATVAYFALGAIWYAPAVFGNLWMRRGVSRSPSRPRPPSTWSRFSRAFSQASPSGWWPQPRPQTRRVRESCSGW